MSDKLIGKICYTINSKENRIDTWKCVSSIPGRKETFYELRDGNKCIVLPKRCVYATIREALKIQKRG